MITEAEHTEVEGVRFSLFPIIPFEDWIEKKQGMSKFNSLSRKDKEKIFLRWKWGFENDETNESLEITEKASLYLFKDDDLSQLSEAWRFHIQRKRNFDKICYQIKLRIGLISQSNPLVDKIVKTFEGEEI